MTHAHTPSTSRRSLLTGLAALGVTAPALAIAGPANEDAELSARFAEFQRVAAEWDAAHTHEANTEGVYRDMLPPTGASRAADEAALLMSGHGEATKRAAEADRALKAIEARILSIPAKTLAGVIIKARVVEWFYEGDIPDPNNYAHDAASAERFVMSLTADLVRIAGG